MGKKLNTSAVHDAMSRKGLNPAKLAEKLDVSREAVSKWLNHKTFPRPDKLLKLALEVGLTFDQLVVRPENGEEPVVAFRKMGSRKTTERHIAHAQEMGRLLRPLVPYLPFDRFVRPPTLKQPRVDYEYIQEVAAKTRNEIGLGEDEALDFHHLIKKFSELQAVLIPVMWGRKDRHENALHIFLPDSMTTWVYLNLDSEIPDFKFWMAHELGHILSPDLRGDAGENFADAFAGALLLPQSQAAEAWAYVIEVKGRGARMNRIKDVADEHLISPISVYYEINHYAKRVGVRAVELGDAIYGAARNVNKEYSCTISELIFKECPADPAQYIDQTSKLFESPFFSALKEYLIAEGKGPGYVQSIMDIPQIDARTLHKELV